MVVAPVGGGGLMSGTCLAAKGLRGAAFEVWGAEPEAATETAAPEAAEGTPGGPIAVVVRHLVAEEVPGNSQLQMLKRAGCDAAECLMSDSPMTRDDIAPWLLRQQRRRESLL